MTHGPSLIREVLKAHRVRLEYTSRKNLSSASHGKAAYRALSEGRWVVDVTGDGSLGLARRDPHERVNLSRPPPMRQFAPLDQAVQSRMGRVGLGEAIQAVARQIQP